MADMFLQYGKERARRLIRSVSDRLYEMRVEIDRANVDDALSYFERRSDIDAVREKYKDRVAIGIRKKEGESGYETYTKSRTAQMIESGELEIITVGTGPRIIGAQATLFTNKTQSWDWQTSSTEKDEEGNEKQIDERDELAAQEILEHRTLGNFDVEIANADFIATAVETGPLFIEWAGGHLTYRSFSPNCVYAKFAPSVMDDDEERGVDYTSLEDASCVVILLSGMRHDGGGEHEKNQYVAFYGRSDIYPNGRRVYYSADDWRKIPPVDEDPDAVEWRSRDGEIGNPLTWLSNQNGTEGMNIPEYPICLFRGGTSITSDDLIPISTSLYESCLEIDVMFSRLMKNAAISSRGLDVLTNEKNFELPRCLEGAVALHMGQTLDIKGQPIGNTQGALEVTKDVMRAVAEGRGVPGYMVIAAPGGSPESGTALLVRTQPLIENREWRIKVNKNEVDRLWRIERALYEVFTGRPLGNRETKQIWNPGRYIIPESELEKTTRIKAAMDAGVIDYVRAVRDFHDLPTDQAAIDLIEKMQDPERTKYKAPTASGAQRTGFPVGLGTRPPREAGILSPLANKGENKPDENK